MTRKPYKIPEEIPMTLHEPAVAYQTMPSQAQQNRELPSADKWNPNVPFHGTQEEWWEHFHRIEEGEFYPVLEAHKRISQWLDKQKM
jgi:hypothetical protein